MSYPDHTERGQRVSTLRRPSASKSRASSQTVIAWAVIVAMALLLILTLQGLG